MRNEQMEQEIQEIESKILRKLTVKEIGQLCLSNSIEEFYKKLKLDETDLEVIDRIKELVAGYYKPIYDSEYESASDPDFFNLRKQTEVDLRVINVLSDIINQLKKPTDTIPTIQIKEIRDALKNRGILADKPGEFAFPESVDCNVESGIIPDAAWLSNELGAWLHWLNPEDVEKIQFYGDSIDEMYGNVADQTKDIALDNIDKILQTHKSICVENKEILDELVDKLKKSNRYKNIKINNNFIYAE